MCSVSTVLRDRKMGPNEVVTMREEMRIPVAELLAKMNQGVAAWNEWRSANPNAELYMWYVDLRHRDLAGINLSNADLSAANLQYANLTRANLSGAWLNRALLNKTILTGANMGLSKPIDAELGEAILDGADLSRAVLTMSNLRHANLTGANLTDSILQAANLQYAILDRAIITGANLWEALRARWSIKGIVCEWAVWEEDSEKATYYSPGEFERIYADTTRIELVYPDGVTSFELNMLPALLQHLTSKFPKSSIRVKSLEEAGGGTKLTIAVDNNDPEDEVLIREEASRAQAAILDLRGRVSWLEGANQELRSTYESLISKVLTAGPQVHIGAGANNVALAFGASSANANQSHSDAQPITMLLEKILDHRDELHLQPTEERQLETEVRSVGEELKKPHPRQSVVSTGLRAVEKVVSKIAIDAAEKALTGHWHEWLTDLSGYLQHLRL